MGSDAAPIPEVEGALAAIAERAIEIVLVGNEARLRAELERLGGAPPGARGTLTLRHAGQVIRMDDAPSVAVKSKKDSSMRVCFDLAKRGEVDAVVSAGNSGAMMACGLFVVKRLRGVERPGILTVAPTGDGSHCAVLDVGANTVLKPVALAQFAAIGSVYARMVLKKARPRVGVLANGEEPSKGTELTRQAHAILTRAGAAGAEFDYLGYAEGRDIFGGGFDVVVTDGFTGNIALKVSEGISELIFDLIRREVKGSLRAKAGAALMMPAFRALRSRFEPDEFGGAPLLGVDAVVVICHGRSNGKAMKNGLQTADRLCDAQVTPAIAQSIARHAALWEEREQPPAKSAAE
jgi:glycerol-3-phosphate acyltransferase PlsX